MIKMIEMIEMIEVATGQSHSWEISKLEMIIIYNYCCVKCNDLITVISLYMLLTIILYFYALEIICPALMRTYFKTFVLLN